MRYSATTWRNAKIGDVVLCKSTKFRNKVCVVVDVLTEDRHSYGPYAACNGVVARLAPHGDLTNTHDYWDTPGAFDQLTLDAEGLYSGPSAQMLSRCYRKEENTTGTMKWKLKDKWHVVKRGDVILVKYGANMNRVCVVVGTVGEPGMAGAIALVAGEGGLQEVLNGSGGNFYTLEVAPSDMYATYEGMDYNEIERLLSLYNGTNIIRINNNNNETGGTNMDKQPLIIKTNKVIKAIKEKLTGEKKAWDDAEAKKVEEAGKSAALAAEFATAHPGFMLRRIESYFGINFAKFDDLEAFETWLKGAGYQNQMIDEDKVVAVEPKEFPGNDKLEKMIRTLEMAENETIEVFPTDEVYNLL